MSFELTTVDGAAFTTVENFSLLRLVSTRHVKVAVVGQSCDDGIAVTFTYTSFQKCVMIDRFTFRFTYIICQHMFDEKFRIRGKW